MGTTNRNNQESRCGLRPFSSTGEVSAPLRSLTAVAFAMGLYGLLLLMTVAYEWSLGSLGGIGP
ncbi:MAG: hypothetical protein R3223_13275, partial [Longimicrobiales bacterium]|nr:hypothetical protein [Longimicrobiales bacterium]